MATVTTISDLLGRTIVSVSAEVGGEELIFTTDSGTRVRFYHEQDCCERVQIEDIVGDLPDLVGSPLVLAEECMSERADDGDMTQTWTFYTFATVKGTVCVRWLGRSNGYYSERVHYEVTPSQEGDEVR